MLFLMASAGASFTTILALSKNDEFRVIALFDLPHSLSGPTLALMDIERERNVGTSAGKFHGRCLTLSGDPIERAETEDMASMILIEDSMIIAKELSYVVVH